MAAIKVPSCLPFSFSTLKHPRFLTSQTPFTSEFSPKQTFPSSTSYCPPVFPVMQSNYSHRVSNPAATSDTPPLETSDLEREKLQTPPAYTPSVWGNYFLSYVPIDSEDEKREHQILKEKVRKELFKTADQPLEHLKLIDAIERLGVAYHFNDQIEESLTKIHRDYSMFENRDQYDLYHASLRFRLLRQHGFFISSDFFKRFTDKHGEFLESLASDTFGILSLYEASHLRVYAEDILEKALSFTTSHLRSIAMQFDDPFLEEIKHALSCPLQKSMARLEARHHIISYVNDPSPCDALLKFAKVDFNILQSFYKCELQELTRWSEGLHYVEKFPLARDRLMEFYLCTIGFFGTLCEPKFSTGRIMICKMFSLTTVIDDMYDLYGTEEEAEALAEAIERWDKSYIQELPDSLKVFYKDLLDIYENVGNDLIEEGKPNHVPYAINEVKEFTRASYKGFKCHRRKDNVTYEEYLRHSAIAIGLRCSCGLMMVPMGEKVQKADFEWLHMYPNAVRATSTICRLLNDILGYETDMKEGRVSTISCYMKQHNTSWEEARAELYRRIEAEWIDINEEICIHPKTGMRKNIVMFSLFIAQTSHMFYDVEDGFRMVSKNIKDNIACIFVDPIPL